MTEPTTTIQILVKTKEALVDIGRKDESYDDIIQRLLKERKKA